MLKKKAWTITAVIILLSMFTWVYFGSSSTVWDNYDVALRFRRLLNIENSSEYADKKKILLWTRFFYDDWFFFGESHHFDNCPKYNNCYMTRSRELVNVEEFDAILFHGNEVDRRDRPVRRDPRQLFVFVNLESPKNRPLPDSFFEDYFNLTMTYRPDSDIQWPYYVVQNIDTKEIVAPRESVNWIEISYDSMRWMNDYTFEGKKKMAAWLVSNCETYGRREFVADELEKYIEVDRIGNCSKKVFPDCVHSLPSATCFEKVIEPDYFFYFAFENTLCQDYVTEKFSNALSHDVIPVVYGGANYGLFAPPHSYIDALDFDSPKALANFLIELSQNKEEYLKYFWWKRFYTIESPNHWTLCNLCERINDSSKPPKTYAPLSNWFEKDKCPIQKFLTGRNHATKEMRSRVKA